MLADDSLLVFLDESGTHATSERVYVGAIVAPAAANDIAAILTDIRGQVLASPLCWSDENERERIRRDGFHFTKDSVPVRVKVLEAIAPMNFRTHVSYCHNLPLSDGLKLGSLQDLLLGMYLSLVTSILQRYSRSSITFVFEQNSELDKHFGRLVAEAWRLLGPRAAVGVGPRVFRGTKHNPELSVVDYLLAVVRESYESGSEAYKRRRHYNFDGHVARLSNFVAGLDRYGKLGPAAPAAPHDVEGESPSRIGSMIVGSHEALRVRSIVPFVDITSISLLRERIGLTLRSHKQVCVEILSGTAYRSYRLPGKRPRDLAIPQSEVLRNVHRQLLHLLRQAEDGLPAYVHGYVRGRSPLTNAIPHIGKKWMQKFDVENFFDSVSIEMVIRIFSELGLTTRLANQLAVLVTYNGYLPAGACTSPLLSNLAFKWADQQLVGLASERGLIYTRYADDLTFTGSSEFDIRQAVALIIDSHGFALNEKKTLRVKYGQSLYVTGLSTSDAERPRLPKLFKRRLRAESYVIYKYGIESHAAYLGINVIGAERQFEGKLRWALSIEPDILSRLAPVVLTERWQQNSEEEMLTKTVRRRKVIADTALRIRSRNEPTPLMYIYEPRTSAGSASKRSAGVMAL